MTVSPRMRRLALESAGPLAITLLITVYYWELLLGHFPVSHDHPAHMFNAWLTSDVLLPSGAALTGIAATTAALETLAWGDERFRRRHLERLEIAKQQFTDMLVHDLRKRMTSILMSLSVLELRVDTAQPRIAELMSTIRISAERMLLLIGNLLDIRKIEEGRLTLHPESVSLRAVVKESLDEHRAAFDLAGVQPRITSGGDMSVRVDRSLFSRVMANLLWNAIQHAPSGTLISIDFGRTSPNRARVAVGNAGDAISTEDMEPLRTALQSGSPELADLSVDATGLGLSFCKLAVEAHGGTISLTSPRPDSPDGVEVAIHLPG